MKKLGPVDYGRLVRATELLGSILAEMDDWRQSDQGDWLRRIHGELQQHVYQNKPELSAVKP